MPRLAISVALLLILSVPAFAQDPELKPKKLTLKAAKAPSPALKYRLLPPASDLEPGNAMICYMRALNPEMGRRPTGDAWEKFADLLDLPFEEFNRAKKKSPVDIPWRALQEIDRGARREYCDWEMLLRVRKDGYGTLLPELQPMRDWSSLLRYRARLEMSEGQIDKAIYTFQTLLAMGRHINDSPCLINSMVGTFVAHHTLSGVEELLEQPNSPNMYWALATLPQPLIDIRKAQEGEKIAMDVTFPEAKKLEKGPLSPQELDRLANICCDMNAHFGLGPKSPEFPKILELVGKVVQFYPNARMALLEQGRKAEELDALPMLQVVLMHNYQQYRRVEDEMLKWTYLPFWEGQKARKQVEEECRGMTMFPFGSLLSAIDKVHFTSIRPDRKIAALRCIEAVRMHVAETGKVPTSFEEIKIVPIPIDPVTGKQFQYKAVGDVVTIYGPAPPGMNAQQEGNAIYYEITIKR